MYNRVANLSFITRRAERDLPNQSKYAYVCMKRDNNAKQSVCVRYPKNMNQRPSMYNRPAKQTKIPENL